MARTGRRRAEVRRSRAPLVLLLVALLGIGLTLAATVVVGPLDPVGDESGAAGDAEAGPEGGDEPESGPGPPDEESLTRPSTTPIDVDLSNLPIGRTLDCSVLDGDAVREALGAPVSLRETYVSGDRVEVSPGVTDVVAEDGCVFHSPRAEARVWVFSAPVGTAYARTLVREARRVPGCTPRPDETGFGNPTLTDTCTGDGREGSTATLRGLFGEAWLTCRLSSEDERPGAVLERAQPWCTEVAATLGAG